MSPIYLEPDEIGASSAPAFFQNGSIFTIDQEAGSKRISGRPQTRGPKRVKWSRGRSSSNMANMLKRETKQKCANFCDNLAFALRNKLFIMEVNLRRRLRQLTRFISKRLDKAAARQGQPIQADGQLARSPLGGASPANQPSSNRLNPAAHLEEETRDAGFSWPLKLTEPLSVESLGVQEERILSRLERIKRVSRKFSSSQSSPSSASSSSASASSSSSSSSSASTLPGGAGNELEPELNKMASRSGWSSARDSSSGSSEKSAGALRQRQSDKLNRRSPFGHWRTFSNYARCRNKGAKVSDSSKDKKICIVCYERAPNILTLPCEHSDICSVCFIEIIYMAVKNSQYPLKCVLCRQRVERIGGSRRLMLSVVKQDRCKNDANRCNLFSF